MGRNTYSRFTPLIYSSLYAPDNHKIIKTLIKHGAEINAVNSVSAFFVTAFSSFFFFLKIKRPSISLLQYNL